MKQDNVGSQPAVKMNVTGRPATAEDNRVAQQVLFHLQELKKLFPWPSAVNFVVAFDDKTHRQIANFGELNDVQLHQLLTLKLKNSMDFMFGDNDE